MKLVLAMLSPKNVVANLLKFLDFLRLGNDKNNVSDDEIKLPSLIIIINHYKTILKKQVNLNNVANNYLGK